MKGDPVLDGVEVDIPGLKKCTSASERCFDSHLCTRGTNPM